ncbi:hypothetical protein HOC80_03840 [archaeon]|nr:hypothetical protein [archaeon]MBT4417210.1 hypothetical protein [archaeon]
MSDVYIDMFGGIGGKASSRYQQRLQRRFEMDSNRSDAMEEIFDMMLERPVVHSEADSDSILDDYMARLAFEEIPQHVVDTVNEGMGISLARKMLPFRFLLDRP